MGNRYCIFTANYLPNLGGVERYTYNLAKALIKKGNMVTVVTSNVFKLLSHDWNDGIEIYRFPCIKILNGRFPVLKKNKDFLRIEHELKQKTFDFAIIQTRFYFHSLYGVKFAKKQGMPSIVLEHGTNHFTIGNRVLDGLGQIYEHWITACVKQYCTNFYGVSEACCVWCRHFHINTKGILYNAVDLETIQGYLAEDVGEGYKKKYNIKDALVIAYTGRLVPEKGILKLISAVDILHNEGFKVVLLVAGDGELFHKIKQLRHPFVILLGKLKFNDVILLLKETDVFCLPTDYPEGFPTSVLEAAACKCYIVTTMNGGSKELILNHTYGTVLLENTSENIAKAIKQSIEDREYRDVAREKTYQRLCDKFTWEKTTQELIEIFERLQNGK